MDVAQEQVLGLAAAAAAAVAELEFMRYRRGYSNVSVWGSADSRIGDLPGRSCTAAALASQGGGRVISFP
jgi:hypothetical protein